MSKWLSDWKEKRARAARDEAGELAVERGQATVAVPWLLEQGRVREAAEFALAHGQSERAAELFLRLDDHVGAADAYLAGGDASMAALTLKEAGEYGLAAELLSRAGQHGDAARYYEKCEDYARAAEAWSLAGDSGRAASAFDRAGRAAAAASIRARDAERRHDWKRAAECWEVAGDLPRAAHAWGQAQQRVDQARVLATAGRTDEACAVLKTAGHYPQLASLLASVGRYRDAARAAHLGGDSRRAARYLTLAGDDLGAARVLLATGDRPGAKERLSKVPVSHKGYVAALEILAELESEDGRDLAACEAYDKLVCHSLARGNPTASTRRWLTAMTERLVSAGHVRAALRQFDRLGDLGLLTPELIEKRDLLMGHGLDGFDANSLQRVGQTLALPMHDRYRFEARVGRGGQGAIFRAFDTRLERPVIIKMIARSGVPDEIAAHWFQREGRLAARLTHPNIVTTYEMGTIDGRPYIAMELLQGTTLEVELETHGAMSLSQLTPLFEQLCAAVQYAHDEGVIHRDIKADNIMLIGGRLKLMDFGLARAKFGPNQTVLVAGTPEYMSPEQIAGEGVDHRTDLYALGVLLYRMVTGQLPYERGNILEHQRKSPIPDPRRLVPSLPPAVSLVVRRAMAKSKEERFGSASALWHAMRASLAVSPDIRRFKDTKELHGSPSTSRSGAPRSGTRPGMARAAVPPSGRPRRVTA